MTFLDIGEEDQLHVHSLVTVKISSNEVMLMENEWITCAMYILEF